MYPRARLVALVMPLVLAAGAGYALGSATGGAATSWRELHRPLHLPELNPGDACPVSPVDSSVDWEQTGIFGGSGTGRGPAYPGLGGADGTVYVNEPRDGWYGGKVFWYVSAEYGGRVLIRGQELKGPGHVRFSERSPRRRSELRIGPRDTVRWQGQSDGARGVPSGTYVKRPGCYGYQVDGATFSRVVVFRAAID